MTSESQSRLLLSQVEAGVIELERAVQALELTVEDAETLLNEIEQLESSHNAASQFAHQALARTLHNSYNTTQRILAINADLDQSLDYAESTALTRELADQKSLAPLPDGTLILEGRYRILQLLHRRPRVHLYLAKRLSDSPVDKTGEIPLVAIREIVLAGLAPRLRQQIEQASFAEFSEPRYFSVAHLPGVGDRIHIEYARHYLVAQPHPKRGRRPALAATLDEFLSGQNQTFGQMEMSTALHWGIQICLAVAWLHQKKNILGELTPATIVVPRVGRASWPPLLLPSWPPPPIFWSGGSKQELQDLYNLTFPTIEPGSASTEHEMRPFAAPETLVGRHDERSDVYTLGALLYLLLTRHTPPSALRRLRAEQAQLVGREHSARPSFKTGLLRLLAAVPGTNQRFVLTPPHLLNERISPLLEHIILRALALDPEQRFASAQDLAKTLEGMKLKTDLAPAEVPQSKASQMRKLLEWLKKELNE